MEPAVPGGQLEEGVWFGHSLDGWGGFGAWVWGLGLGKFNSNSAYGVNTVLHIET
jgi:hypothetical protein